MRTIFCCRLTSAIAVTLTILLIGCASQSPLSTATVPATAISTLSDRAIVPGERIGPVRLTGKIDEVVKLFGPGKVQEQRNGKGFVFQTWDAVGLWVRYDPGTGNVVWISVEASGSNPWAEHSTPDGIRLGTRQQDMVSIMGAPERTVTGGGLTSFYYDRRGIRFSIPDTGPHAGKIVALRVVWPSVPHGDMLVVPSTRISGIELGQPIDTVLALLGGGYWRGEIGKSGVFAYYWPHLALSLYERSGRVVLVSAAPLEPADAPDLRYATVDGVGLGSTATEVRHIYGDPPETKQTPDWVTLWIYPSRGINFGLDNESRVQMIGVFPAKRQ